MASRLTTTAGRSLRISAPAEESKRTSQTSPLFGVGTVAMGVLLAESLEVGQLAITPLKIRRQDRLGTEDSRALVSGELTEVNC